MKDFLKILFVLIVVVVAFVTGRNYGESTITESKEYKDNKTNQADFTRAEEELRQTKEKLQTLLDSADLKKADEVYGKILTLFLVDLGLRISEQKQKDLDEGKAKLSMCIDNKPSNAAAVVMEKAKLETSAEELKQEVQAKAPKFSQLPAGRYKSTEWTLVNSNSNSEIQRNLEKLKLTDIDAFIKGAPETPAADVQKYRGTFRGTVLAVDKSRYGSLVITIKPSGNTERQIAGEVRLFREGSPQSSSEFSSNTWGYSPAGYQGNMVAFGPARFLQIYKIENADKIAGNFYERLPNGTTKLIGSFILNRTDRI